MEDLAKSYCSFYESAPKWLKFVLALLWSIPTSLYRLAKSVKAKNTLGIVLAIVLLICNGFFILWIVDLVTILLKDKVYWLD